VPEVDDDQLAALRRLRVAFGPIEVVEVVSHDPAAASDEHNLGARMADPGRMTPEERKQAQALLTRALSDPNWQTASQALDDLMRKPMDTDTTVCEALPSKGWHGRQGRSAGTAWPVPRVLRVTPR
jgi:hypothetical protein